MHTCAVNNYLLHVVVQSYDGQRGGQAGVGHHGGSHGGRLTDVTVVTGLQEVGRLVVLVQNFDLEVG